MKSSRSLPFVFAAFLIGQQAEAASCFTAEEAGAAHLRALQQQFNVAALNCQTVNPQPGDPSFSDHYNSFVSKFGGALNGNAEVLRAHFKRAGGSFDNWMTKVANAAGQRVMTDANFCQSAWDRMESAMSLTIDEVQGLAVSAAAADPYAPSCPPPKAKHVKSVKSAKAAKTKTDS